MLKILLRMQISSFLHSMFKNQAVRKGRVIKGLFALLMVYAYGCVGLLMGLLFDSLLEPFHMGGLMWLYYGFAGILAFFFSFIFSIFMAASMLYQAKDNELLLSMPIPTWVILSCRVSVIWLSNLFSCVIVVLPAGIVHWVAYAPGVRDILCFAGGILSLPFLCTAFSCLFGYLITLLTHRMRRKNVASLVLSLLFLGAYFTVYAQAGEYVQKLIAYSGQIAQAIRKGLFPIYCFGVGMAEGGISLVWWLLCAIVPFVLIFSLLNRSFVRLCTHTGGAVRKKFDQTKAFKTGSLSRTLLLKELQRLWSSSVYMLNGCLGALMAVAMPIFFLVKADLMAVFTSALGEGNQILPGIYALILCFSCAMILVSAPSVSLEGKHYWISRSTPIPARDILWAKARAHLCVALPAGLIGSVISCFACRPAIFTAVMLILIPAALNLFMAHAGICINLRFPRLDWTSEAMVVKQGMAVGMTMLSGYVIVIAMAGLYILLRKSVSLDIYMLLWTFLLLAGAAWLHRDLTTKGSALYENLE